MLVRTAHPIDLDRTKGRFVELDGRAATPHRELGRDTLHDRNVAIGAADLLSEQVHALGADCPEDVGLLARPDTSIGRRSPSKGFMPRSQPVAAWGS